MDTNKKPLAGERTSAERLPADTTHTEHAERHTHEHTVADRAPANPLAAAEHIAAGERASAAAERNNPDARRAREEREKAAAETPEGRAAREAHEQAMKNQPAAEADEKKRR